MALQVSDVQALQAGRHPNPFAVLGMHRLGHAPTVTALLPRALSVTVIGPDQTAWGTLERQGHTDVFHGPVQGTDTTRPYRLRVTRQPQQPGETPPTTEVEDPYRFPPLLGEMDAWLLAEGQHLRPFECLGAHLRTVDGVAGVAFSVWAPNAQRVAVVGDFNGWDGRTHPMRLRSECGVWELFVPALGPGQLYKFEIMARDGSRTLKSDPMALRAELRPNTASVVHPLPDRLVMDPARAHANGMDQPISVYEVHLGSWRKHDGWRWLSYRELADTLVPYARDMGFTHLELLPISEHPYDDSWGYQPVGLYAPTARFGTPEDFRYFVAAAHAAGLGVILDWVPAHFPTDAHGLGRFDGTHLYEHADPKEGFHQDWNTLIYNYGRAEVRNHLVGNALYWLERFGVDGLRVDAVASMLYRDYSRAEGQWVPNRYGGRENLEAIAFLRQMNHTIGTERPGALTIAEESTAFPGVSRPPGPDLNSGGLGFHYKWNMGWMHDTLRYAALDPIHRRHHHQLLTFGLMYAHTENFVLPLSHDEVVHGKGSMLGKMAGDDWQRFANLRALYGFMWAYPGKKLLFMGSEFAQPTEWNANGELPWQLLEQPAHQGVQRLVRDLNQTYRAHPALHRCDVEPAGFRWLAHDDASQSVVSFLRLDHQGHAALVVCNFTPVPRRRYRVGAPQAGRWQAVINTDHTVYGGSGVDSPPSQTDAVAAHGWPQSLVLDLPPLSTLIWVPAT